MTLFKMPGDERERERFITVIIAQDPAVAACSSAVLLKM